MDHIRLAGILELREAGPSATGREVQSGHSLINDYPARGSLSQTPVDDEGPSWPLSLQYAKTEGRRFICKGGGVSQAQKQSAVLLGPQTTEGAQRVRRWERTLLTAKNSVPTLKLSHVCLGLVKQYP